MFSPKKVCLVQRSVGRLMYTAETEIKWNVPYPKHRELVGGCLEENQNLQDKKASRNKFGQAWEHKSIQEVSIRPTDFLPTT